MSDDGGRRKRARIAEPPSASAVQEAQVVSALAAADDATLTELLMTLTEEERIRFCRTNRRMQEFCRGSGLYRRLVKRDFDALSADWQKYAIVGGTRSDVGFVSDAQDGSWALYYRLLQRNRECQRAISLYLATRGRADLEGEMAAYAGVGPLPIEAFYALGTNAFVKRHFTVVIPGLRRALRDGEIDRVRRTLFGDTALPWSRFFLATTSPEFCRRVLQHVIGYRFNTGPMVEVDTYRRTEDKLSYFVDRANILLVQDWNLNARAVELIIQPDGPMRHATEEAWAYEAALSQILNLIIHHWDNPWYTQITIIDRIGIYAYLSPEHLMIPTNLFYRYRFIEHLIGVDYEIAVRTGDRRRFWYWQTSLSDPEIQTSSGVAKLKRFIDALKNEEIADASAETIARFGFRYEIREAVRLIVDLRAAIDADADHHGLYGELALGVRNARVFIDDFRALHLPVEADAARGELELFEAELTNFQRLLQIDTDQ